MASEHFEVLWSPTVEDTFLIWSTNLQLYQVQSIEPEELILAPKIRVSDKTAAKLAAINSDHQYIKCVAWHNGIRDDITQHVIAVGQANGKISITSFAKQTDLHSIIGKGFVPKSSRPVNALVWNPKHHNYLAAGLDKAGKESSIFIIDVQQCAQATSTSLYDQKTFTNGKEMLRPILEWSAGETAHSVEFSKHDPNTLLAGMNNRLIKLYDIRAGKLITSVSTKAIFSISCDPFDTHRFSSSIDNVVHIWDARNLERPVLNLADFSNKSIVKLSWCPTRHGFLGCLSCDSSSVRLYDIQTHESASEDIEPAVISRIISGKPSSIISSFSWHPSHENRIMVASYSKKLDLMDHVVLERVSLNISIRNNIVWSCGKGKLNMVDEAHPVFKQFSDISTVMKDRALNKYGLQTKHLSINGEMTHDSTLKNLWTWLEVAKKLTQDTSYKINGGTSYKYQGVWSILNAGSMKSDILNKQWIGIEGATKTAHAKVFRSEERNLALTLCSWGFEKEGALDLFLDHLEGSNLYTRAAAIAVFNLHISDAIKILQRGAAALNQSALNTTAMALAGFTNERKALWRETCSSLLKQISDPYIRVTFAFLTGDSESFDPILNDKFITVHDRVAFACKYLSDSRLLEYLKKLKGDLATEGNLDGILLTGLEPEGINLLQKYIDITGDLQTPAFVTVHALQSQMETNDLLDHWVEQYRNLLDSLQLWKERAEMDVMITSLAAKHSRKSPQQIYISCNFCLKSISAYTQTLGRSRNPYAARFGAGATFKSEMCACPHCHKPLPRCSLCLQHMGTPSKRGTSTGKTIPIDDNSMLINGNKQNVDGSLAKTLSKFSSWFTWCQGCRHGGHALHIMEWFKEHNECPVASCFCKCMAIDGTQRLGLQSLVIK